MRDVSLVGAVVAALGFGLLGGCSTSTTNQVVSGSGGAAGEQGASTRGDDTGSGGGDAGGSSSTGGASSSGDAAGGSSSTGGASNSGDTTAGTSTDGESTSGAAGAGGDPGTSAAGGTSGGGSAGVGGVGGVGGAGSTCFGDTPTRVAFEGNTLGQTLMLCPGIYKIVPLEEPGYLGVSPWSANAGCTNDTACDCTQGYHHAFRVDVQGGRSHFFGGLATYCPTPERAFETQAETAWFTLEVESEVTIRPRDNTPTDNRGGYAFEISREPLTSVSMDGLLAYWPFDGDAFDASDRNIDLVESADASYDAGRIANGLVLDGSTTSNAIGRITSPTSGCDQPLGLDALPVTIAAWVRVAVGATGSQSIFASQASGGPQYGGVRFYVVATDNGVNVASLYGSPAGSSISYRRNIISLVPPMVVDRWFHVATVMVNRTDLSLFVNGERVQVDYAGNLSADTFTDFDPVQCPGVGYYNGAGTEYGFNGIADEIYVFNRALTDAEIALLAKL